MTPNYEYIQNLIKNTLANKPIGHEITPEEHQNIELALLEYAKNLELLQVGTLIGFADANTVPVQPNGTNAAYLNTMPNGTTVTFHNFRSINGQPISVTTEKGYAALNILFWNAGNKNQRNGWTVYTTQIHISAVADLSYFYDEITLQNDITTNVACGGISARTTIPAGTKLKDIIMDMIFTYIKPATTMSGGGEYEVGTSQNPTIKYKATDSSSANVTKIKLEKSSGGSTSTLETRDPAASGTEYTYTDSNITSNTTYSILVYDDVKGDSSDNTKEVTVSFKYKYFYGSENSIPLNVRNLDNDFRRPSSVYMDNTKWFLYVPKSYTQPTSFKTLLETYVIENETTDNQDKKGVILKKEVTVKDAGGNDVEYYRYMMQLDNPLGSNINIG